MNNHVRLPEPTFTIVVFIQPLCLRERHHAPYLYTDKHSPGFPPPFLSKKFVFNLNPQTKGGFLPILQGGGCMSSKT